MILIAVKNMLKLLQNENIQLRSDATHGTTCNRWPLHACGVIDKHHHFHTAVHAFASSETLVTRAFLLENDLRSHKSIFGGDFPDEVVRLGWHEMGWQIGWHMHNCTDATVTSLNIITLNLTITIKKLNVGPENLILLQCLQPAKKNGGVWLL